MNSDEIKTYNCVVSDYLSENGAIKYTGIIDDAIKFIENNQLMNVELWGLLSEQFNGEYDSRDNGWRGEFWGKLMRGAAMICRYTQNEKLYDILENTVCQLLKYQDSLGRFSTYSTEKEFHGWDLWGRKYVMLGMIHFCEISNNDKLREKIILALMKHLDYITERIGKNGTKITDTSEVYGGINSSSILEPVVLMYKLTGKKEYLDFASYIVETGCASNCNIFELAYENKLAPFEYPERKAYELMSCFEGLAEYYRVTGEKKWFCALNNFVDRIIETDITIIGCAGCEHELLDNSVKNQTNPNVEGIMQETCVTVTWIKLCYQMLRLTCDAKYADQIEKSFYNALLGSINTENMSCTEDAFFGDERFSHMYMEYIKEHNNSRQVVDSYSPLRLGMRGRGIGGYRDMRGGKEYCGCCISIAAAGFGIIPKCGIMQGKDGIYVSMYSECQYIANVDCQSITAVMNTEYPKSGDVDITLHMSHDTEIAIMLRIPGFANNTKIFVNDNLANPNIRNGYALLNRYWSDNDRIRICIDMNPRIVCGGEKNKKYLSVHNGPIVLARDARIGEVGKEVTLTKGELELHQANTVKFNTVCEFNVKIDGHSFTMIDYASAGKTWNKSSLMEAWMPINLERKEEK